jgi:proteasome lid subunit RPN8/RPN11
MKVRGIKEDVIQALCEMGRHSHPQEFAALLREEEGIIFEVNLLPGTTGGKGHATIHLDMMPLDTHVAGSAHSHPNGVLRPSSADLNFFPQSGRYHIIVAYPYHLDNWRCFLTDGTIYSLEVVG